MEDDKRKDRNLAKAEAARRLARLQRGVFWIGTERTLTKFRHYNLVFLHARRKTFPAFGDIAVALQEVWPWGEVASVEEVESRLAGQWPANGRQRYTLSRNILDVVGQAPWRMKYTQAFIVQRDVLDYMHPDNVHLRSGNGGEMEKKSCTF